MAAEAIRVVPQENQRGKRYWRATCEFKRATIEKHFDDPTSAIKWAMEESERGDDRGEYVRELRLM